MKGAIATTLAIISLLVVTAGTLAGSWAVKNGPLKYLTGAQSGDAFTIDSNPPAYTSSSKVFRLTGSIRNETGGEKNVAVILMTDSSYVNSDVSRQNFTGFPPHQTRNFSVGFTMKQSWVDAGCPEFAASLGWAFFSTSFNESERVTFATTDCGEEPTPTPTPSTTPTTTETPTPAASPTPATGPKFCCVRDTDPPKCDSFPADATCAGGDYSCGGNDLKCQAEITSLGPGEGRIGTTITIRGTYLGDDAGSDGKVVWDKIGPDEGLGGCKNKRLTARWIDATKIEAKIDDALTDCKGKTGKVFVTTDWGNTVEAGTFKITEGVAATPTPTESATPTPSITPDGPTLTPTAVPSPTPVATPADPTPTATPTSAPTKGAINGEVTAVFEEDAPVIDMVRVSLDDGTSRVEVKIKNSGQAEEYSIAGLDTDKRYLVKAFAYDSISNPILQIKVEATDCPGDVKEEENVESCELRPESGPVNFTLTALVSSPGDTNANGVYEIASDWTVIVKHFDEVIDTAEGPRLVTIKTISDFISNWRKQEGL